MKDSFECECYCDEENSNNYEPEVLFIISTIATIYYLIQRDVIVYMGFSAMIGCIIIKYWLIKDGFKR